jgi:hypothetical protein
VNKFELMNTVLLSELKSEDKNLLLELLMRANDQGECFPSVERLCKARGIKHEKNFKGADKYLPGLVTKTKRGRKNFYVINTPAVAGLSEFKVNIKHTNTPAAEGVNTPAVADDTPAVADNTPAVEGANSSSNNSVDNSSDSSSTAPSAAVDDSMISQDDSSLDVLTDPPTSLGAVQSVPLANTPAVEGVLDESLSEPVEPIWDTPTDYKTKPRSIGPDVANSVRDLVVIAARGFGEKSSDPYWDAVLRLALDASFEPDNQVAGSRIGKAQEEVKHDIKESVLV